MRLRHVVVAGVLLVTLGTPPARAAVGCPRAVAFIIPGVTWQDVERVHAPHLLALAGEGAAGSISVDAGGSDRAYASAFTTIGAGARARADGVTVRFSTRPSLLRPAQVTNVSSVRATTAETGYRATPGALASSLSDPVIAIDDSTEKSGAWALLAAMDGSGRVDLAGPPGRRAADTMTSAVDRSLREPCATVIVHPSGLERAEESGIEDDYDTALRAADDLLGHVRARTFPDDLLVVVAPTSPVRLADVHLGMAVATGPGFSAGSTLQSASTRLPGIVTPSDVAPTILAHRDAELPSSIVGRPFVAVTTDGDSVDAAIELDRESVFVHGVQNDIIAWYVAVQIVAYAAAAYALGRSGNRRSLTAVQAVALAILLFPASTYVAGIARAHELGTGWLVALLLAIDAVLTLVALLVGRRPLDRLFVAAAGTFAIVVVDTLVGNPLQLNTIFGNLPILGARFAGLGNNAFSVLGASALVSGALVVQRWGPRPAALLAAGGIFAVAVIVDGAPQLGSDVGGVIALVPSVALTLYVVAGRRVGWRFAVTAAAGAVVVVGVFLALDLTGPPEVRSHLARLAEAVRDRGVGVLVATIGRKLATNIGVFDVSPWTFFVPPVVAGLAWVLLRWRSLADSYPNLRAGLLGAMVAAVLGFAVNDSGIIIPAMFLPFLIPAALLVHVALRVDRGPPTGPSVDSKSARHRGARAPA